MGCATRTVKAFRCCFGPIATCRRPTTCLLPSTGCRRSVSRPTMSTKLILSRKRSPPTSGNAGCFRLLVRRCRMTSKSPNSPPPRTRGGLAVSFVAGCGKRSSRCNCVLFPGRARKMPMAMESPIVTIRRRSLRERRWFGRSAHDLGCWGRPRMVFPIRSIQRPKAADSTLRRRGRRRSTDSSMTLAIRSIARPVMAGNRR